MDSEIKDWTYGEEGPTAIVTIKPSLNLAGAKAGDRIRVPLSRLEDRVFRRCVLVEGEVYDLVTNPAPPLKVGDFASERQGFSDVIDVLTEQ